ncbi:terminase small subunit [Pseudomonas sp. NA-150]|uniref:terminase small subunit n=1 Tax=Pseudomonas sp. NA-150 TaxID=3367525 RepID=UPI0037CC4E7C
MEFLSKSAFAAARNWSKPYVSKLAKQGRLVLNEAGLVDVVASDLLIAQTSDPSKMTDAVRQTIPPEPRPLSGRVDSPSHGAARLQAAPSGLPPIPLQAPDFQKARARREHFTAMTVEADFYKNQGTLVELSAVDTAAYNAGRLIRDLLLGVPTQIAPELAAMTDPWRVEKHLLAAIRRALEDAERISTADLKHALSSGEHHA